MSKRVQQVSKLLKKEISNLIEENISGNYGMITVMAVDVSDDLKEARCYVSCFDKEKEKEILKELEENVKDFQHTLGQNLKMRYTPKIRFEIDTGAEKVERIEEILNRIKKKGK